MEKHDDAEKMDGKLDARNFDQKKVLWTFGFDIHFIRNISHWKRKMPA